jgi:hypothetical protein
MTIRPAPIGIEVVDSSVSRSHITSPTPINRLTNTGTGRRLAILAADEPNNPRLTKYWREMLRLAKGRGELIAALAMVNDDVPASWEKQLRALGYTIVYSHARDCDHRMIAQLVHMHDRADVFIVASGDGAFVKIACMLRRLGKQVIVFSAKACLSKALLTVADEFLQVSENRLKGGSNVP